jgi:small conductance mechanosensitive channel
VLPAPATTTSDDPLQALTDFVNSVTSASWFTGALSSMITIILIVISSLFLRGLLVRSVRRVVWTIADHHTREDQDSATAAIAAARKAQRVKTLGSLFNNLVNIIVLGIMFLLILTELGVNLAPLLASASILGAALAFGAQSLVADFMSGIFILMEDQYGVGDVVDVGDASGTVEDVQLRITKIRSIDGTLWFVRNGQIMRVGNMSQDYSKVVLDIGVSYNSDVALAKEVLNRVAQDFATAPETRDMVLETPEVLGVQALAPDSIQIRLVITTPPGDQWGASRVLREQIKEALTAAGVEIPLPQSVMWMRQFPDEVAAPAAAARAPEGEE